jgi:uncharacterized membrane protein
MNILPPLDIAALTFFLLAWGGYAIAVEWGPGHLGGLNARIHGYREIWMRRALTRELRMFDAQIMAAHRVLRLDLVDCDRRRLDHVARDQ